MSRLVARACTISTFGGGKGEKWSRLKLEEIEPVAMDQPAVGSARPSSFGIIAAKRDQSHISSTSNTCVEVYSNLKVL